MSLEQLTKDYWTLSRVIRVHKIEDPHLHGKVAGLVRSALNHTKLQTQLIQLSSKREPTSA